MNCTNKKKNNRIGYPNYYEYRAILYHNFQKNRTNENGFEEIIVCRKEGIIKLHNEDFNIQGFGKIVIPINFQN